MLRSIWFCRYSGGNKTDLIHSKRAIDRAHCFQYVKLFSSAAVAAKVSTYYLDFSMKTKYSFLFAAFPLFLVCTQFNYCIKIEQLKLSVHHNLWTVFFYSASSSLWLKPHKEYKIYASNQCRFEWFVVW